MFGLFKRNPNPDELIHDIVDHYKHNDVEDLVELCNNNYQVILDNFEHWSKIPEDIQQSPEKLESYVNSLIFVADMFHQAGEDSLVKILNPSDNPIDQWQDQIVKAQELMAADKLEDSKQLLLSMIPELEQCSGNVREQLLPKVYGHLGIVCFYMDDIDNSIVNTNMALKLCRETNNLEGVVAYTGTLVEIMDQMGILEDGKLLSERIEALKQLGRPDEADEFAAQYGA